MKALRFLTILLTTFSLYSAQTLIPSNTSFSVLNSFSQQANANDQNGSFNNFMSGGKGGEVKLGGQEKKGDDEAGFNMNMILLFAAVTSAVIMVAYCFDKLDTWIYTATAAIYIGAEIANYNSYKKQSEREMKAYNADVETNMAQVESLNKAATETDAAADAAERRGMAAQIAAVGFFAAGAIALIGAAIDSNPTSCWVNSLGQVVSCVAYGCVSGLIGENSIEHDYLYAQKEIQMIASTNYQNIESYIKSSETDLDFLLRNYELKRYGKGALSSMTVDTAQQIEFLYPEKRNENRFVSAFKHIGLKVVDLFFPKADASMGKLIAMGLGAAAAVVMTASTVMSTAMIKFFFSGWTRGAFEVAMGGVAQLVAKDANDAAKQLKGRANQYRELAAKLQAQTMATANHNKIDNTYELGKTDPTAIDKGSKTESSTCFTGSKGKLNEDKNCACKQSNGCKKPEIPKIKMAKVNIPDAITASTSSLGAAGNSIFNGNLEGGLAEAAGANKNAARLKRVAIGVQKKYNEDRLKGGKKPIDFDKMQSSTRAKLIQAAVSDLKNLNDDAKNALASRFPGVFGDDADVEKDPNKNIKLGDTNVKTGAIKDKSKTGKGSAKKDPMAGFSFDLDDSKDIKPEDQALAQLGDGSSSEDQVEMNKDDIDEDRNKNIFTLITKRYFKTAYPTFFESKE